MNNLTELQEVIVRNIKNEDIDELVQMAIEGYGNEEMGVTREKFESHLEQFPEGQFCVEYDGKLIGSCSSVILNIEDYGEQHTFVEVADGGYIRNHDPAGKNLYGIDVVVHPSYRTLKVGRRLYEARKKLVKVRNLKSIIFGGRLPNYHKYAEQMTPEEYVSKVVKKEIHDPVLNFQLRNGFEIKGLIRNYLEKDAESLGNAVLLEWRNPDYNPGTLL